MYHQKTLQRVYLKKLGYFPDTVGEKVSGKWPLQLPPVFIPAAIGRETVLTGLA
jgi:hypothetical protein